jgi:hypothetical protein
LPIDVIEAMKILSVDQRQKICDLGWGEILEITIDAVRTRELYKWLLSKIDIPNMVLRASPNITLPLNKHAIQTVLGVPAGTTPPPKHSYNVVNAERAKLAATLGCPSAITIDRLKAKLREHQVHDLSIRCFFLNCSTDSCFKNDFHQCMQHRGGINNGLGKFSQR